MVRPAARRALGKRRLLAHPCEAARRVAGTTGAVLVLARLRRHLGIKLADEHRPDSFPWGKLGMMFVDGPGPVKCP